HDLGAAGLGRCRIAARRPLAGTAIAVAPTATTAGDGAVGDVDRRGEAERHLAVRVDVVDLHLDLVAEVEHVLHLVDALAATELGDVEQAVAAREDVHERTELGDVHDPAGVDGADVGGGRVEDELDLALGLVYGALVRRPERDRADHAVVV